MERGSAPRRGYRPAASTPSAGMRGGERDRLRRERLCRPARRSTAVARYGVRGHAGDADADAARLERRPPRRPAQTRSPSARSSRTRPTARSPARESRVRISSGRKRRLQQSTKKSAARTVRASASARRSRSRRRAPASRPASLPPDRHAPGCRRSCRYCAPAGRRCARRSPRAAGSDCAQQRRRFDVAVRRHGADRDRSAGVANVGQVGDAADVDDHAGPREPQLHRRNQAVSAGQHLGIVAVLARAARSHRRSSWRGRSRSSRDTSGLSNGPAKAGHTSEESSG